MQAIYITVGTNRSLMAIPDSRANMDGHPVLTYTYMIYSNKGGSNAGQMAEKEAALHSAKNDDPDYLGEIIFEIPGRVFNYFADGPERLSAEEVEEAIEQISEYRDNSSRWGI